MSGCVRLGLRAVARDSALSSLRESMPTVAAFVDDLREALGKDHVDGQIRAGMRGEGCFWAREGGHEVGSRMVDGVVVGPAVGRRGVLR